MVTKGKIDLIYNNEIIIKTLKAGDSFGELSFFSGNFPKIYKNI